MDILKVATEWARAEVFSTKFFILMGVLFMLTSVGFWQLGKTDLAKAYVTPMLVCGAMLIIIGAGLLYTNIMRVSSFEAAYNADSVAFVQSEIARVESTLAEYSTIVFRIIPIMIAVAALLIMFMASPTWRAASITAIGMLIVILIIDGNAHARIVDYYEMLKTVSLP